MSERTDRRSEGREPDERLADWVDGRMSARDRERFVAELRVNPELKRELEQYEKTVGVLRAALRAPTAPSRSPMADRVFAAIASERAAPAAPRRTGFSWPHAWWSLATAAALLACTFWLSVWSGSSAAPQTSMQVSRDADEALLVEVDKRPDTATGALPPADPASRAKDLAILRLEDKKESTVAGSDKPGESGAALAEQENAASTVVTTATVPSPQVPAPTVVPPARPFRTGESTPDAGVGNPPTPGGGVYPTPGPADVVPGSPVPGYRSQLRDSMDSHAGPATPGPAGPSTGGPGGSKPLGPAGAAVPPAPPATGSNPSPAREAPAEARTGSDDFYLGATRRQVPAAEKAPATEKAEPTEKPQASEESPAERAKAAGGKADAAPAPKLENSPLESASVARLPFVEVHAVLPKPPAAGAHDAENDKSKSDGGQTRKGGRGSPASAFDRDTLAATGTASAPLDGEALRASLEQFLAGAVTPATVPAAVQWRTKRGQMSASPWMAEHESGKDVGRLADEPQAERPRTTPTVEERVWLIEGEREDVALLLSRMAELGRARRWEMRSGEMPAPASLAKNPEVPDAASATGGGGGGEAASRGLAGAAKSGGDPMRVVLRIRLSAR